MACLWCRHDVTVTSQWRDTAVMWLRYALAVGVAVSLISSRCCLAQTGDDLICQFSVIPLLYLIITVWSINIMSDLSLDSGCSWRTSSQTRNVLDCDQSNYSSRIIFSCTFTRNQTRIGSNEPFQRYGHPNYTRRLTAAILDLDQPEVETFDPPTSKTVPRTKHEVDRMTRCHSKFSKMRGRSVFATLGT